jgi:hypothetical protein
MADPKLESRTDSRTTTEPRPLPPEEDDRSHPAITQTFAEPRTDQSRADQFRKDEFRADQSEEQSQESVSQSGNNTNTVNSENVDRGISARRTASPSRTQTESRGQREWEQGPNATADQTETDNTDAAPLFSDFEINDLRSRWNNVQAGFVDSPRRSVQQADELVAVVVQRITSGFADKRTSLEKQWDSGDNVSTEDLRVALQRYRSFFGRLLNAA